MVEYAVATAREEIASSVQKLGLPVVVKTATAGYDGKGQAVLTSQAELDAFLRSIGGGAPREFVIERFLDLACEISVLVVREDDGTVISYPVQENEHRENILTTTLVPARVPKAISDEAVKMDRNIIESFGIIGVLCVEMFVTRDGYTPQLVSWNGGGFDLPVLHYRSLIHGVAAARYWDWGDDDKEFKWNNYLGRYHTRHLDLMDVLAMYQPRANAPLDQMAKLCGFPGKLGMDGSKVMDAFQQGEIDAIRNYCETDVMNTWLVYLRFQKIRGTLTEAAYAAEIELARHTVSAHPASHWQEFLTAWA